MDSNEPLPRTFDSTSRKGRDVHENSPAFLPFPFQQSHFRECAGDGISKKTASFLAEQFCPTERFISGETWRVPFPNSVFHISRVSRRKMFLFFLTILLISRTIDYWKIEFREWSYATISRFFYRNSKVLVLFFHIRCGKCFVSKHIYIIFVYLCMKVYDNCCTMHKLDYREFKFD